ncbi:hypothetical protein BK011_06985 [Tenericutes bacterium MZ-XQ]|nr:hypothetical protein BK011_06985 [Tenericutes bacterium MZ-XQ]
MNNLDRSIRYYEILLNIDVSNILSIPLPTGYHFEFYKDGDQDAWIKIELSAREFLTFDEGIKAWDYYFKRYEHLLPHRMVFLVDSKTNEKIGTASAFFNNWKDDISDGYLHWVAIKKTYQGKGLAKALILHTLNLSRSLGYKKVKIPTQTTSPVACKIYFDLGAYPANLKKSYVGYQILKTLFNQIQLDVPPISISSIYNDIYVQIEKILKQKFPMLYDFDINEEYREIHMVVNDEFSIINYDVVNHQVVIEFQKKKEV